MFFDGADGVQGGPWGTPYVHSCFEEDVDEDGNITIEYKYDNDDLGGSTRVKWRVEGHEKVRMLRYFGSSIFALWWCQQTDGIEEEECCQCIYHGDDGCKCDCHSEDEEDDCVIAQCCNDANGCPQCCSEDEEEEEEKEEESK